VIGWLHTDSLNPERDAEVTEKNVGEECHQEDPDQEFGVKEGKKNFRIL
jgi:hypothetical protein